MDQSDGAKNGEHRSGSEWAAACVLGFAALAYAVYAAVPGILSGALLGVAGAWIGASGLGVQVLKAECKAALRTSG